MGKRLDRANNNITILIDQIIGTELDHIESNLLCPKKVKHEIEYCNKLGECAECKKKYYKKMRKRMLKQYIIKKK